MDPLFFQEYQFIVDVINACTHDISLNVDYNYLRAHLVDIFTQMDLSRAEGNGNKASYDIMVDICNCAKRLSKDDFVTFVDVIGLDYQDVANAIRQKYFKISGKTLPRSGPTESLPQQESCLTAAPATPITPAVHHQPNLYQEANSKNNVYPMNTRPRGAAIIINNVDFDHLDKRKGSDTDVDNLKKMFARLDFECEIYRNLKYEEMKKKLIQFSKNQRLEKLSALAVVILTHGTKNDIYFATDGNITPSMVNYISRLDLQNFFNSRECELMKGKPKMFILQACRGEIENPATTTENLPRHAAISHDAPRSETVAQKPQLFSDEPRAHTADMCFFFSSSVGYKAYRSENSGSLFIQELTNCILKAHPSNDILEISLLLNSQFTTKRLENNMMTMTEFSSQLDKKWFIIPDRD